MPLPRLAFGSRGKRVLTVSALLLLVLVSTLAVSMRLGYLSSLPAAFVDELEGSDGIRRLLVIAPHSDDEVIAAAGLVQKVLANGGDVLVAVVTNGDGSLTSAILAARSPFPGSRDYIRLGERRQQESLAALATLGLAPQQVLFLGYPDRGIESLWKTYWSTAKPLRSQFTRVTRSPYELTYNPDAVYSGQSLYDDLLAILKDWQPDTVVMPHPNDSHPDHWACGAFMALALANHEGPAPRQLLYLGHRGDFPVPRGNLPFAPLLPPLRLVNETMLWYRVTYPNEYVDHKATAMSMYRSQRAFVGAYLDSFVRQNELFGLIPISTPLALAQNAASTPSPLDWELDANVELTPALIDSYGDTLPQGIGPGADFVALYAGRTESELLLVAHMAGDVNRVISYSFCLRADTGGEVLLENLSFATSLRRRDSAVAYGTYLLVRVGLDRLAGAKAAVVSFESRSPEGLQLIDRLGWACLSLATPGEDM